MWSAGGIDDRAPVLFAPVPEAVLPMAETRSISRSTDECDCTFSCPASSDLCFLGGGALTAGDLDCIGMDMDMISFYLLVVFRVQSVQFIADSQRLILNPCIVSVLLQNSLAQMSKVRSANPRRRWTWTMTI